MITTGDALRLARNKFRTRREFKKSRVRIFMDSRGLGLAEY